MSFGSVSIAKTSMRFSPVIMFRILPIAVAVIGTASGFAVAAGDLPAQASGRQVTLADGVASAVKSRARQSLPAQDRAASYREGDLFRHSRVVVPLLVMDLEPVRFTSVRPMSGRSVGVRPVAGSFQPMEMPPALQPTTPIHPGWH